MCEAFVSSVESLNSRDCDSAETGQPSKDTIEPCLIKPFNAAYCD